MPDKPDKPQPLVENQPDPSDIHFLEEQLNEYNIAKTKINFDSEVAIFVRDQAGTIAAGLYGWIWGGCMEIKTLWVREGWRGQHWGTQLLAAAEKEARQHNCHQMLLDTHSFQAPDFYQRQGFVIHGVLEDYPIGYKQFYLHKRL